jgi:hypothetical protein
LSVHYNQVWMELKGILSNYSDAKKLHQINDVIKKKWKILKLFHFSLNSDDQWMNEWMKTVFCLFDRLRNPSFWSQTSFFFAFSLSHTRLLKSQFCWPISQCYDIFKLCSIGFSFSRELLSNSMKMAIAILTYTVS